MQTNQIAKALNQDRNNSLIQYGSSLMGEEAKILALHHKSQPFQNIGPAQMFIKANLLLADISLCTGWPLPTGEPLKRLTQLFIAKINFDYLSLTYEEILYAFSNAHHVKNWGAAFNLSLLDEVVTPFVNKRAELREIAAKQESLPQATGQGEIEFKEDPAVIEARAKETFEFWRFEIEENIRVDYIPSTVYEVVLKIGQVCITPFGMEKYLYKAKSFLLNAYTVELVAIPTTADGPVKTGLHAELTGKISRLKGEPESWQDIEDVQKYAKAFFVVGYFKGECGVMRVTKTPITKQELEEMPRSGICPLCKTEHEDMAYHMMKNHKDFEKLNTLDNDFRKKVFPYLKPE